MPLAHKTVPWLCLLHATQARDPDLNLDDIVAVILAASNGEPILTKDDVEALFAGAAEFSEY